MGFGLAEDDAATDSLFVLAYFTDAHSETDKTDRPSLLPTLLAYVPSTIGKT